MTVALRRMAAVAISATALTIAVGSWPLIAQESGTARAKTARKAGPTARVPNYFGQLGLSDAQKESIYKIQAKHQPRIEALEKQLEELRAQSMKECEAVLTAAQKKTLAERRAGAAEARAKKGSAPSKP